MEFEATVKQSYLETIRLIERLHRRFLDVIKTELDRLGIEDINNVQTLILSNISNEQLTVGELTARGYYLGSNVSYNVKKLVENGYLNQERSPHDRRMTRVRVSEKGLELCQRIDDSVPQERRRPGARRSRQGTARGGQPRAERAGALLEQLYHLLPLTSAKAWSAEAGGLGAPRSTGALALRHQLQRASIAVPMARQSAAAHPGHATSRSTLLSAMTGRPMPEGCR